MTLSNPALPANTSTPTLSVETRTLYIFRHGETDWNQEGRMQGGTDIPLNANGRQQAEVLREFFKRNPVEAFVSSDLQRAKETAQIAMDQLVLPFFIESRIRETNLGVIEGLTRPELLVKLGEDAWSSWVAMDQPDFRFPGGESKQEHMLRFRSGIESILMSCTARTFGVATHGGAMRRFIHYVRPELAEPMMIPNCTVFKFTARYGGNGHTDISTGLFTWTMELAPQI